MRVGVVFLYRAGFRLLPTLPSRPRPSLLSLLLARSAVLPPLLLLLLLLLLLGPPLLLVLLVLLALLVLVLRLLLPFPRTRFLETKKKHTQETPGVANGPPGNSTCVSVLRFVRFFGGRFPFFPICFTRLPFFFVLRPVAASPHAAASVGGHLAAAAAAAAASAAVFAADRILAISGVALVVFVVVSVRFVAVVAFGAGGVANVPHHAAGAWGKQQKNKILSAAQRENKRIDRSATLTRRLQAPAFFREHQLHLKKEQNRKK